MSGNVELNPGPMKKCPKCKKMMSTRSNNCKCGYLLCYVAAGVLHFGAFISKCSLVCFDLFLMKCGFSMFTYSSELSHL